MPLEPLYDYVFPSTDLLTKQALREKLNSNLEDLKQRLGETFKDFNIEATVLSAAEKLTCFRFEVQPNKYRAIEDIETLKYSIAMNWGTKGIRIEPPDKPNFTVGIELAKEQPETVNIRDVLESADFEEKNNIPLVVGRSFSDVNIVDGFEQVPQLLITGPNASGKTTFINSILTSVLFKKKPNEVQFVLIDTHRVDLCDFNGLPHLMYPVITEPLHAAEVLMRLANESDDRISCFNEAGALSIDDFNADVLTRGETDKIMQHIIIVITDLRDLIVFSDEWVSDSLFRIASKAKTTGIYIVAASQQPMRWPYATCDQGADGLCGGGDALYWPYYAPKPMRIRGAFISDKDIKNVVDYININNPQYTELYGNKARKAWEDLLCTIKNEECSNNINEYKDSLETGFRSIDYNCSIFNKGAVSLVLGRPNIGKTGFVINLAANALSQGVKVCYISFDQSSQNLTEWLLKLGVTKGWLEALIINDSMYSSMSAREMADYIKKDHADAKVIIIDNIDYLGLEVIQWLKDYFPEASVILSCRVGRECEYREDHRIRITDVPYIEMLDPYVDNILALYREDYYRDILDTDRDSRMDVCMLKGPFGRTPIITTLTIGDNFHLKDWTIDDEDE